MRVPPIHEMETEHEDSAEDPMIVKFLAFLEKNILENPHRLVPLTQELLDEINELASGVEVDLDALLDDD